MKNKVAAVVFNTVLRDARVIKEATTLFANNYDITIFGIQDNQHQKKEYQTTSGVPVRLVDWKTPFTERKRVRRYISLGVIGTVTALLYFYLCSKAIGWQITVNWPLCLGFALFVVVVVVLKLLGLLRYKNIRAFFLAILDWDVRPMVQIRNYLSFFHRLSRYSIWHKALVAEILESQPDIVHCHDLFTVPVGLEIKKKTGARVIYDSHEIFTRLASSTPLWGWWYSRLEKRISTEVDGFITINTSIAAYLRERYPALPQTVLIRNATRPIEGGLPEYDGRLHKAAGLGLDTKILLYQGGYAEHRGLYTLVDAAGYLPDGWVIVFMGWGKIEDKLRERAAANGGHNIQFIPPAPQEELLNWTVGASLGIIPYENVSMNHYYCTPNKLWEYPAASVPVLCSPFPELKAVIDEFDAGWLLSDPIEPKEIGDIVAGINADDLAAKKNGCRRFIKADNWHVYEEALLKLYSGLVSLS